MQKPLARSLCRYFRPILGMLSQNAWIQLSCVKIRLGKSFENDYDQYLIFGDRYGWALFRGLADLHAVTSDAALKTSITTFIQNSVKRILNQCTADYNCVRTLTPGESMFSLPEFKMYIILTHTLVPKEYTFKNGTNPRDQIEAMEYLIALTRVLGAVPPAGLPTVAPVSPSGGSGRGGGSGGNGGNDDSAATHATIGFTSLFLSSLLVVAATFVLYGR
jgi:hypothetical protein